MKPVIKPNWLATAGLLLALPAACFVFISILKYVLGINGPFDYSQPFLERLGIKEAPGWNINLLILLGPIAGFLLAISQALVVKWKLTKQDFHVEFIVTKKWFPMLVAAFSITVLAVLFFYLIGENCTCQHQKPNAAVSLYNSTRV